MKRVIAVLLWAWAGQARAAAPVAPSRASADKTYEQLKILVEVLAYIEDGYVDEPDSKDLIAHAADGMVRALDPFSQYMDPENHKEIKTETDGQFGGLGIRLGMKDDWLTVVTPMPGTPAFRAGILPNDRISEIDGESTKDLSMNDALAKLRGAPGTKVKLGLLRGPEEAGESAWKSLDFQLTREIVKIASVDHWMLEPDMGYLRVSEFSAKTSEDTLDGLKELVKEGARSLVLDLRNNPGGLLSSAVDVASYFVGDEKLIVYTQGRKPESRQEFHAGTKAPFADLPLVVLVNEGSASGAEIVAGALQDHKRAQLMGMRTFGKASVQSVIALSDGSGLRLTVARYYTPSGRSIHRDEKKKTGGITPDIAVPIAPEVEAKLYSQWELLYAKGRKPRSSVKSEELVRDETLDKAREYLRARARASAPEAKGG